MEWAHSLGGVSLYLSPPLSPPLYNSKYTGFDETIVTEEQKKSWREGSVTRKSAKDEAKTRPKPKDHKDGSMDLTAAW